MRSSTISHPAFRAVLPDGRRLLVSLVAVDEKDWPIVFADLLRRGATCSDVIDLDAAEEAPEA